MKRISKPAAIAAQSFSFEVSNDVRIVLREGEPWVVAKDVADALGYSWNGIKTIGHVPEEWRAVSSIGGVESDSTTHKMLVLSELGLYFFLNRSDKPKALPFQKKVAGILATIRKTGTYTVPKLEPKPRAGAEKLTASDMANLRRCVWRIVEGMPYERAWIVSVWKCLRNACGVPKAEFTVDMLPILGRELRRILEVTEATRDGMELVAEQAKVVTLAGGDRASAVSAISQALGRFAPKPNTDGSLAWSEGDVQRLLTRSRATMDHPEVDEVVALLA